MKKSITKNYIYSMIYEIITIVIPLITTPYLSRILGAENIGIYSYTLSIATYFVLFGSLGIAMYGRREIAYVQQDRGKRSKIMWEIVILRFCTMIISTILFYIFYVNGTQYQIYYKILILELISNCIDISWFFQGLEEFKKTVTRNILVKLISLVLIFTLVKTKEDLAIYFLIYVGSNLIGNLSLWFYLPKYTERIKIKELNVLKHIKPTIALFIPQVAIKVYTVLDKTMIGKISSDMTEVGNYEQTQKITGVSLAVITALGTVVSPRIANNIANDKKEEVKRYLANSFNFVWLLGIPIMFGLMAIAQTIVPWFLGEEFEKSITIIMIGAPIVVAIGMSNVSGMQYLIPAKKQGLFTKSVVTGAVFNFCLNLLLIPLYGAKGAMVSSVLAETLISIVQLIGIRKDIPLKIAYQNSFKYIVSGAIMFAITYILGRNMPPTIITTIVEVIVGMLIYGVMLLILKDKFLLDIINKIINKIKRK